MSAPNPDRDPITILLQFAFFALLIIALVAAVKTL